MRLITHNMLKCNIRGVTEGYPLILEADNIQIDESNEEEFDKGYYHYHYYNLY